MFLPLDIDEIKYIIEHYHYLVNPEHFEKSKHTVCNRIIDAKTFYNCDYHCYMTLSENYKRIVGLGNMPDESLKDFLRLMTNYLNNISKRGRHKKDTIVLGCRIPTDLKDYLDSYCSQNNINQGELIADLLESHRSNSLQNT